MNRLNKEENGPHFNRVAGLDANFRFGDLIVNTYVARSFSPDLALQDLTSTSGNAYASRAGFNYQSRTWQFQAGHSGIGARFNDEVGFVPRRGIDNFDGRFGRQVRPPALSKWLRQMQPHIELDLFLRQDPLAFWRTNESATISLNTQYATGSFYDGY